MGLETAKSADGIKMNNNNQNAQTPAVVLPHVMPPTPTKVRQVTMLPTITSLRSLLPAGAFLIAFATVMTILVIHMNNTATRHHQFKVNMSRENDFLGVSQDNPDLITYIREIHIIPAVEPHHHPFEMANPVLTEDIAQILKLLKNKRYGAYIEAGAYSDGKTSKSEYLERELFWHGLLIQQDPTHFFKLKRHNRNNSLSTMSCLSSTSYPKEITYPHEFGDGVKANKIHHANTIDDPDWFNTRVKCFPFYSLMLATNLTSIDLFILESGGTELQVLETIPFDRVRIQFIDVHLLKTDLEKDTIKEFLVRKNYTFLNNYNSSYVFRLN